MRVGEYILTHRTRQSLQCTALTIFDPDLFGEVARDAPKDEAASRGPSVFEGGSALNDSGRHFTRSSVARPTHGDGEVDMGLAPAPVREYSHLQNRSHSSSNTNHPEPPPAQEAPLLLEPRARTPRVKVEEVEDAELKVENAAALRQSLLGAPGNIKVRTTVLDLN